MTAMIIILINKEILNSFLIIFAKIVINPKYKGITTEYSLKLKFHTFLDNLDACTRYGIVINALEPITNDLTKLSIF